MPIITIKGEVSPDGKLKIENLPALPAGPVSVTIRTLMNIPGGGSAVGRDVAAGRKIDDESTGMASYDNLPDPHER